MRRAAAVAAIALLSDAPLTGLTAPAAAYSRDGLPVELLDVTVADDGPPASGCVQGRGPRVSICWTDCARWDDASGWNINTAFKVVLPVRFVVVMPSSAVSRFLRR